MFPLCFCFIYLFNNLFTYLIFRFKPPVGNCSVHCNNTGKDLQALGRRQFYEFINITFLYILSKIAQKIQEI